MYKKITIITLLFFCVIPLCTQDNQTWFKKLITRVQKRIKSPRNKSRTEVQEIITALENEIDTAAARIEDTVRTIRRAPLQRPNLFRPKKIMVREYHNPIQTVESNLGT